jgi:MoxR-like ATPase
MTAVTPADIQALVDDITTNVLVEGSRDLRTLAIAAIAGVNAHQLGPPGSGKSLRLRAFCERITGARYFSKTVHAMMPADAIIGGYDMPEFAKSGEFKRNTDHYAPNAHVVFLDEITRANGPTLDAILPMLNAEERLAEFNGGMAKTPILFMVTASNFMPEPDDAHLGAFVDRITLMQYIDYVQADESFMEMLVRHHARVANPAPPVTVSLEQFQQAQAEVAAVNPAPEFREAYAALRRQARGEGLGVSDRRWMELGRVARAGAWLAGRTDLIPNDLAVIEDGLWRDKDERAIARQLVMPYQSKFIQEAAQRRTEAEPHLAQLLELRPLVEGTAQGQAIAPDVMSKVQVVSRSLGEANKRVEKTLNEAERQQELVPDLRELHAELQAAKKWLEANFLPASWPAP